MGSEKSNQDYLGDLDQEIEFQSSDLSSQRKNNKSFAY